MTEPTSPHEPLEMLTNGALVALDTCAKLLRKRGWDAGKKVGAGAASIFPAGAA